MDRGHARTISVLPNPPPQIANYEGSIDASNRATKKAEWELNKKTFDR